MAVKSARLDDEEAGGHLGVPPVNFLLAAHGQMRSDKASISACFISDNLAIT